MKELKKWAPLAAIIASALALVLYVFAPVIKHEIAGTATVWDSIKDDKIPMILVTVVLAIASVALAVVCYLKGANEMLRYVAVAVMVVTAVFCFSSKGFIVTDMGMKDYASMFDLGIGAILGGILFIVSAVATILPKFLKD